MIRMGNNLPILRIDLLRGCLKVKCKDTKVMIEAVEGSTINRNAITVDVYAWLKDTL